jgi:hypothetical protein
VKDIGHLGTYRKVQTQRCPKKVKLKRSDITTLKIEALVKLGQSSPQIQEEEAGSG